MQRLLETKDKLHKSNMKKENSHFLNAHFFTTEKTF